MFKHCEVSKLYEEFLKLDEDHYNGVVSDEEFEERGEQITAKVQEILERTDESVLIKLEDKDVEWRDEYSPVYNGQESYMIEYSDDLERFYGDDLSRFLDDRAQGKFWLDKIAVAAGAKYVYSHRFDINPESEHGYYGDYYFK